MNKVLFRLAAVLLSGVLPAALQAAPPAQVQAAVQAEQQLDRAAAAAQNRINKVSADTQAMLNEYLSVTQQTDQLRSYDDQLQQFVQAQRDEMASLTQQMSQVGVVEQGLMPLLVQMVDSLEQYIKLDIPFHVAERLASVQRLRDALADPRVPMADKFNRIIQAYDREIAAGRQMQSYRGTLAQGGRSRLVNFLRIGHLLLAYQTLDHGETGYWDRQKHAWVVDNDYANAVREGIAMANRQATPDLLALPVPAPEVSK